MIASRALKVARVLNIRRLAMQPIPEKNQSLYSTESPGINWTVMDKHEFSAFKKNQQKFQQNDGLPIHLKCGLRDKLLMYLTFALGFIGLMNTFAFVFGMAFKKKN